MGRSGAGLGGPAPKAPWRPHSADWDVPPPPVIADQWAARRFQSAE